MAKFAQNETKPFSPIDSKLLGTLAEAPQPATSPSLPCPEVPPAHKKDRPQAKRSKSEVEAKPTEARGLARQAQPKNERLNRVVRCLFTPSEEQEIRNLMSRLRESSGLTLGVSHLMRPFLALLLQSEEELKDELAKAGLRRPINDRIALAAFDRQLAVVIHAALQRTTPELDP